MNPGLDFHIWTYISPNFRQHSLHIVICHSEVADLLWCPCMGPRSLKPGWGMITSGWGTSKVSSDCCLSLHCRIVVCDSLLKVHNKHCITETKLTSKFLVLKLDLIDKITIENISQDIILYSYTKRWTNCVEKNWIIVLLYLISGQLTAFYCYITCGMHSSYGLVSYQKTGDVLFSYHN